jgi:hypothetical protein
MAADNSRKIPTAQAVSVGNFRLAKNSEKSDKSAMSTVDEVRNRIRRAFEVSKEKGSKETAITLAKEWGFGRDHIREFLIGKKDSLKYEVVENLSEHFGIPIEKPHSRIFPTFLLTVGIFRLKVPSHTFGGSDDRQAFLRT